MHQKNCCGGIKCRRYGNRCLRSSIRLPQFRCYSAQRAGPGVDSNKAADLLSAHWMQFGPDRSLTVAFRGLGKSLLASYYALWRLRMDPEEKILVVSATAIKSLISHSSCCERWLKLTFFNVCFQGQITASAMSLLMLDLALLNKVPQFVRFRCHCTDDRPALHLRNP